MNLPSPDKREKYVYRKRKTPLSSLERGVCHQH